MLSLWFVNTTKAKHYNQRIPKNEMSNFETALKQIEWSNLLSCEDIDSSCNTFLTTINKVLSSFTRKVQCNTRKKNILPWLNEAL